MKLLKRIYKLLFERGCVDYTQPYKEGPSDSGFSKWDVPSSTYNTDRLFKSHKSNSPSYPTDDNKATAWIPNIGSTINHASTIAASSYGYFDTSGN